MWRVDLKPDTQPGNKKPVLLPFCFLKQSDPPFLSSLWHEEKWVGMGKRASLLIRKIPRLLAFKRIQRSVQRSQYGGATPGLLVCQSKVKTNAGGYTYLLFHTWGTKECTHPQPWNARGKWGLSIQCLAAPSILKTTIERAKLIVWPLLSLCCTGHTESNIAINKLLCLLKNSNLRFIYINN